MFPAFRGRHREYKTKDFEQKNDSYLDRREIERELIWANPDLFLFIFVLSHHHLSINCKSIDVASQDSNPGLRLSFGFSPRGRELVNFFIANFYFTNIEVNVYLNFRYCRTDFPNVKIKLTKSSPRAPFDSDFSFKQSVTRWLVYAFNIWPFTKIKIFPKTFFCRSVQVLNFAKY